MADTQSLAFKNRLENWKFIDAKNEVAGNESIADIVSALAKMFGNSGWFDGDIGLLVSVVVEYIGEHYG